jgi:carboxyl-terminal processing protease
VEADDDTDAGVVYDGPSLCSPAGSVLRASEILAGALQDYGRALIRGDSSTHGKGTVQSVNPLRPLFPNWTYTNDPGAVKLTIKKFYRASGASTQLKGVVPDVVLPSLANELKEVGESSLDNPLPWDTIPAAKYDQLNRVAPYVNELARRSTDRIGNDKEFAYIREDIEQLKKAQADKTVSLNEQDRLKEKSEMNGRQKARTHERLARKEGTEKTYELSLEQADLPGLPPPVEKTNSIAKLSSGNGVSAGDSASLSLSDVTGDEEAADDEKAPTPDATMVESERILIDYVSLLASRSLAAAEAQTK